MATSTASGSPPAQAPSTATFGRAIAYGLLAVTALAFLVMSWGRISGPFGDSDEGVNGAVWAYAGRSLRELGPVESALGGRHLNGSRYATHPPMIVATVAVSEVVAGEHGLTTRAPAWLGSLIALALVYRLGRRLGFSPISAAGATAVVGTSGMFITYGPMLDTPVTSFPFGVGLLLLWVRDWQHDEQPSPWLVAGVALAGSLAGWQCTLAAGLMGLALAGREWRRPARAATAALPYVGGALAGVALTIGWSWWTYGDLGALGDKLGRRSGAASGTTLADLVGFQVPWLAELLGLGIVGLVGAVVALWDRRVRPAAAMSLATVALYAVAFREAAAGHQYWCYWVLLPTAVGSGWLLDRVERDVRARSTSGRVPVVAVAVLAVLIAVVDLSRPGRAVGWIDDGHRAVVLLEAELPDAQRVVPYVGEPERPDALLVYELGRTGQPLTSAAALRTLAAEHPDDLVYVTGSCGGDDATVAWCRQVTSRLGDGGSPDGPAPPRLVRAGDLAAATATGNGG